LLPADSAEIRLSKTEDRRRKIVNFIGNLQFVNQEKKKQEK